MPPAYAAEMVPFNPLVGEFRVHYAGFFDPGFGHSAGHGPKHAPGMISHEGGSDGRAATTIRCQNRTPAADLACAKLLDWHGPVTEVWTVGVP